MNRKVGIEYFNAERQKLLQRTNFTELTSIPPPSDKPEKIQTFRIQTKQQTKEDGTLVEPVFSTENSRLYCWQLSNAIERIDFMTINKTEIIDEKIIERLSVMRELLSKIYYEDKLRNRNKCAYALVEYFESFIELTKELKKILKVKQNLYLLRLFISRGKQILINMETRRKRESLTN